MANLAGLVNSRFSERLFLKSKNKNMDNDKGRHLVPTSGLLIHVCVHIHAHMYHPHMHLEDNKKLTKYVLHHTGCWRQVLSKQQWVGEGQPSKNYGRGAWVTQTARRADVESTIESAVSAQWASWDAVRVFLKSKGQM